MDVPTTWFVQSGSKTDALWSKHPTESGYGMNPLKTWDATQSNTLKTLVSSLNPQVVLNTNTASPDANTVYDTQIAWVPIAIISNAGTGIENITQEQLQHLYITGRMPSGENLQAATRDPGSGTRNGAMNSLGIDPSWGRGDNVGKKIDDAAVASRLGPKHQVSNTGGAGVMETVVQNTRLAIGYTGLMGASRAQGGSRAGLYEVLNVKKTGGASYLRPSIANALDTDDPNTGWQIGGAETFATVGDPFATGDIPGMTNQAAADYIRNIKISIDQFVKVPADPCHNMPGELMATMYTLMSGLTGIPSDNPSVFVPNPGFSAGVHDFILNNTLLEVVDYGSVSPAGKVPLRAQLTGDKTYSDGRTYVGADDYYTDSSGAKIKANTNLSLRNRLAGDFNYDGKRNADDAEKMMLAVAAPRAFEPNNNNNGDGYVIPEIIGDFNGDGSFDAKDIRYWADGLVIDSATGKLNRAVGFKLVDKFDGGNYFNTTPATGVAYQVGDSKADVAGSGKVYPGAEPVGADGKVDAKEIDYVVSILRGDLHAAAFGVPTNLPIDQVKLHWSNPDDAAWMDLSCDMNGDLIIDKSDLDVIVHDVLHTEYGDVNLDGRVSQSDMEIAVSNQGKRGGWAMGDMNGDGVVDSADLLIIQAHMQ
jgi:hypothetical protein